MKLLGVQLENWGCLSGLELTSLESGITVIHAPNGTGKSSLVRALRCGLLDFEATSTKRELLRNRPWSGREPTRVTIDWEQNGRRYRVCKTFARRGESSLSEWTGTTWRTLDASVRGVYSRVREMLSSDSSSAGLYQLLWIDQGDYALPNKLDPQVQRQLSQVLQAMVTGRDAAFRERLDQYCAKWFTREKMEHRKGKANPSRVFQLQEERAELQKNLEIVRTKRQELDRDLSHLEKLNIALPGLRDAVAKTKQQVVQLHQEKEGASARLLEHSRTHGKWLQAKARLEAAQRDQDLLVGWTKEAERLHALAETYQEKVIQLDEAKAVWNRVRAPDEQMLTSLRLQRTEAQKLEAQLRAAAITLCLEPKQSGTITIARDSEACEPLSLAPGTGCFLQVRQRLQLELPEWGLIRVGRGTEDVSLDQAARQLAQLENGFAEVAQNFGESVAAPDWLERLEKRYAEKQAIASEIKRLEAEVRTLAPQGLSALQLQQGKIVRELESRRNSIALELGKPISSLDKLILQERLDLATRQVNDLQGQLDALCITKEDESIELRLQQAQAKFDALVEELRTVEGEWNGLLGSLKGHTGLHIELANAEADLRACQEALDREELEAEAHKFLRLLFDECKDTQVQQVLGPIHDRVLGWMRYVGLPATLNLQYGSEYMPTGFSHPNGTQEVLTLDHESCGTVEQLCVLIRLALGGMLAHEEGAVALFDEPFIHTDAERRCKLFRIMQAVAKGNLTAEPRAYPLQILIFTCHPEWFDGLPGVKNIDLAKLIQRS